MTKKDYQLVAKGFNEQLTYWRNVKQAKIDLGMQDVSEFTKIVNVLTDTVCVVAAHLYLGNPQFKKANFFEDCGIEIKY